MSRLARLAVTLLVALAGVAPSAERVSDPATRALIEADWAIAGQRGPAAGATAGGVTTQEDAAGGVDGVINGSYGFHCASGAANSWWQVDLGQGVALDRVVVYNRCDGGTAPRAAKALVVLVSDDGKAWREAYKHDGSPFGGQPDNRPLVVRFGERDVQARFVRLQERTAVSFHLDEIQVYAKDDPKRNIALRKPADQSGVSRYSTRKTAAAPPAGPAAAGPARSVAEVEQVVQQGRRLLAQMQRLGVPEARLGELAQQLEKAAAASDWQAARWAAREIALANPLLDFGGLVFVKRRPCFFGHMCDQFYGSLMEPGGGLFVLENLGGDFKARDLIGDRLPPGNFLSPDLSPDGRQIVFAFTRSTGDVKRRWQWADDVCYHLYAINPDGTGLRQLTDGPHDDIHPRFLPDGGIAFMSTRRGGYCRCGGRPVPTYTLHRIEADGAGLTRLSAHETNEWHPCVLNDGRLVYTRWDYVDRHTNLAHSLWTSNADGTNPSIFFGNYNFDKKPWGLWHAMAVPGSRKVMAVAGAHHGFAKGALVLLDLDRGQDGLEAVERLTPEVSFPEAEGWPAANYATPFPLSEDCFLVSYSPRWSARTSKAEVVPGLYLQDRWGHRELLYRDPAIASMSPVPLRPRPMPVARPLPPAEPEQEAGRFLLLDVCESTDEIPRGGVKALRIIQILPKTTVVADKPKIGAARQISARQLLGTVPVEADGSAHFTVPAGVPVYFQAVDADGMAVQSMRSITYAQPGETLSCTGCHEPRHTSPPNRVPLAALRAPSAITPGPDGSMPFSYPRLVQPVLDKHCVGCHSGRDAKGGIRLTGAPAGAHTESYRALAVKKHVHWFDSVNGGEWVPRTYPGKFGARASRLTEILKKGPCEARLSPDELGRLYLWMDLNVPFYGVYEPAQVAEQLRGGDVPLAAILK